MSAYTETDLRELFDWDWACTTSGQVLHDVARFTFDPDYETSAIGVASCGLRGRFAVPGFLSRMGAPRCRHCCNRLAIPNGDGSPKNTEALRPWVEKRRAGRATA